MSPSSTRCRWSPTPDQLLILKELYRRGLTNPNASQIQKITAHLSFFGTIQGKNVFYWFQNHKARDRQNIRKKIAKELHQQHLHQYPYRLTSSAFHQSFNSDSAQNLFPQGTVAREETWGEAALSRDGFIRTDGHDLMMITDVGSTFPCCRNKPLETLELFPLTSPTVKDQETAAA